MVRQFWALQAQKGPVSGMIIFYLQSLCILFLFLTISCSPFKVGAVTEAGMVVAKATTAPRGQGKAGTGRGTPGETTSM